MNKDLKNNKGNTAKWIILIVILAIIVLGIVIVTLKNITNREIEDYKSKVSNLEDLIKEKDDELKDLQQPEEDERDGETDTEKEETDNTSNAEKDGTNNTSNTKKDEVDSKSNTDKNEIDKSSNSNYLEELVKTLYDRATTVNVEFSYNELNNKSEAEIRNYFEVMTDVFTENGQKIFEKEHKGFINIRNDKAYMTAGDENTGECLMNLSFTDIKESKDTITATVVRKMSKEPLVNFEPNELDKVESYVLKDDLIIKKIDGKWLIDKYSWVIP